MNNREELINDSCLVILLENEKHTDLIIKYLTPLIGELNHANGFIYSIGEKNKNNLKIIWAFTVFQMKNILT